MSSPIRVGRGLPALWAAGLTVLAVAAGCGGSGSTDRPLVIFCAASLAGAMTDLTAAYEESTGISSRVHSGGSQVLAQQILEGAEADVFAPADLVVMERVRDAGLAGEPVTFAGNRLVVVVSNTADGVDDVTDLANDGVRVVLAGPGVPAGRYAGELLAALHLTDAVAPNIVSREENVTQVVTKVALGEADAGIAYATDARGRPVRVVEVLETAGVDVEYPAAATTRGATARAGRFIDYLRSARAQAILASHGFSPIASRKTIP